MRDIRKGVPLFMIQVNVFYKRFSRMEIKNYSCMKKIILEKLKAKFEGVSDYILDRIAEKLAKTVKNEEEATTVVEG